MLTIFVLNYYRTLPKGMPLVSTCSAAISAAWYPPAEDREAHFLLVQWGVMPDNIAHKEHRGHYCTFTTHRDVRPPVEGGYYWGLPPSEQGSWAQGLRRCWRFIMLLCEGKGRVKKTDKESMLH